MNCAARTPCPVLDAKRFALFSHTTSCCFRTHNNTRYRLWTGTKPQEVSSFREVLASIHRIHCRVRRRNFDRSVCRARGLGQMLLASQAHSFCLAGGWNTHCIRGLLQHHRPRTPLSYAFETLQGQSAAPIPPAARNTQEAGSLTRVAPKQEPTTRPFNECMLWTAVGHKQAHNQTRKSKIRAFSSCACLPINSAPGSRHR